MEATLMTFAGALAAGVGYLFLRAKGRWPN
jgi:hypothetical protein